ncbi:MAG: hypothetical protein JNN15_15350 [Blastocatellia bacterium]|nr:hypothetical protein [Blastocatellia bacterium]
MKRRELLSTYLAISLLKQQRLADYLGEHFWNVDLEKALIDFGLDRTFPIQILGSESHISGTWLWAWANHQSQLPEQVTKQAWWLHQYGKEHRVDIFIQPELPVSEVDGHEIAIIASGLCKADGYYAGNYGNGSAFLLIYGMSKIFEKMELRAIEVSGLLSQAISTYEVDHRLLVKSLFGQLEWQTKQTTLETTGVSSKKEEVVVKFDSYNRIAEVEAKIDFKPSGLS